MKGDRKWTDQDLDVLYRMHRSHTPLAVVAAALKRTRKAVQSKRRSIGLTKWPPQPFSSADDEAILLHRKNGRSLSDIARKMKRARSTVAGRWRKICDIFPHTKSQHDAVKPAAPDTWTEAMQGQRFEDVEFKPSAWTQKHGSVRRGRKVTTTEGPAWSPKGQSESGMPEAARGEDGHRVKKPTRNRCHPLF